MEAFDNTVRNYLSVLDNEYVSAGLALFLILYAGMAAPKLPAYIANLFDYTLFKLAVFFMIVYVSRRSPTVAIIAAVAVMVSIMTLNKLKFGQEMMAVVSGRRRVKGCTCECDADDVDPEMHQEVRHEELPRSEMRTLHEESASNIEESPFHPAGEVPAELVQHEELVATVLSEKARQEEELGRVLSQEEMKRLCSLAIRNKQEEVKGHDAGNHFASPL